MLMKRFCNLLIIYLLLSWLSSCGNETGPDNKPPEVPAPPIETDDTIRNTQVLNTGIVHQKGFELKKLNVIQSNILNAEEKVLIATLQGLVAKTSSEQIYIDEGGPSSIWKEYMISKYKIKYSNFQSLSNLLDHYKKMNIIEGYIVYDRKKNKRSLTAATALCGPTKAIAVDKSIESEIISTGIGKKIFDVSDKTEKWVYKNYPYAFSKNSVAELSFNLDQHLRDYITLTNSFVFYDGITDWRTSVLKDMNRGAYCFGYGEDEFKMVEDASRLGVSMLPAEAANLATLSSIYDTEGLKQRAAISDVSTDENVHYVTFLVSDGDNIAYNLWSQHSYFNNSLRGTFPVGYTLSPSLYDLAPAALRWYYENSTQNDYFVCGPSGSSYIFPSRMPSDKLDAYLDKLNEFAGHTGLAICNILDQGAINKMSIWNKYLSQPNIDALIYTGYGESPHGSIQFSDNGKPIIEQRDNLWEGLEEEDTLIRNINSRPANPYSVEGYTLVFVHVWTKDLSNIKSVIDNLNSNVRVVTPDIFVRLVQKNLKK